MILNRFPHRLSEEQLENINHAVRKLRDDEFATASAFILAHQEALRKSNICVANPQMAGPCFEQVTYEAFIRFGIPKEWLHVHVDVSGDLKKNVEWDIIVSPPLGTLPPALNGLKTSSRERGHECVDRQALATRDHYMGHPLIGNRTSIKIGWFYVEYPKKLWTIEGEIRRRANLENMLHADAKARTVLDEPALTSFINFYAGRIERPTWFDEKQKPLSRLAKERIPSRSTRVDQAHLSL